MGNPVYRPQWMIVLTSVLVAGMSVAGGGQTLSASGVPTLHAIVESARNADLRWPDFSPYKAEVAKLYQTNGYSLIWVQNGRVRPQGLAVIELLQHADASNIRPLAGLA